MHTFLPFESYEKSAQCLNNNFLRTVICYCFFYFKSLMQYYDIRKKDGFSGLEGNTIAVFWRNHELELARYALTFSEELLTRPLQKVRGAESFAYRKGLVTMWTDIINYLEEMEFPGDKPPFIGDEEFHSGFRAFLLLKGCQIATFRGWKKGIYPDHVVTRNLPPKKRSWKREDYHRIWEVFGRPESFHFGSFGWSEEPDDCKYFYTPDREPHMIKEIQRKIKTPVVPFLDMRKKNVPTN